VSEGRGPLFNRKTIQDISKIRRTGWFRVHDARGYTRTPYVTPFAWDHHLPEEIYKEYARAGWPEEDDETITVGIDPFGQDAPTAEPKADEHQPPHQTAAGEAARDRLKKHIRRGRAAASR
jgi:hypothetical protein